MPLYYSVIAYIVFGILLFIGGKVVNIFDVDVTLVGYSLVGTFFSALLPLPMMGLYNRIKKRPYFYRWNNIFFYTSIVFFILSPLVLWYMLALQP